MYKCALNGLNAIMSLHTSICVMYAIDIVEINVLKSTAQTWWSRGAMALLLPSTSRACDSILTLLELNSIHVIDVHAFDCWSGDMCRHIHICIGYLRSKVFPYMYTYICPMISFWRHNECQIPFQFSNKQVDFACISVAWSWRASWFNSWSLFLGLALISTLIKPCKSIDRVMIVFELYSYSDAMVFFFFSLTHCMIFLCHSGVI